MDISMHFHCYHSCWIRNGMLMLVIGVTFCLVGYGETADLDSTLSIFNGFFLKLVLDICLSKMNLKVS